MKTNRQHILLAAGLTLAAGCLWLAGCATGPDNPPTSWERRWFHIETNYMPTIQVRTNVAVTTNYVTAAGAVLPAAALPEPPPDARAEFLSTTNYIVVTNYSPAYIYTPNAGAQVIIESGRAIGDIFGVGGLAGTLLGGVFGLYGTLRSTRARKTAAVLAQIIETGRAVLATTAEGKELQNRWRAWMIEHEAEAGVIREVKEILEQAVDPASARVAAARLSSWMQPENSPAATSSPAQ